jgi:catechol 2,3-dioxygenase-like lactoylglutathione lyase family enzyme
VAGVSPNTTSFCVEDVVVGWQLQRIHHLGLTVADIDRSIAFYRDVLGMKLIGRRPSVQTDYVAQQTGYADVELNVASFQVHADSPQTLEVVQYMNHVGDPCGAKTNQAGSSHLCLLVDDFESCYNALREAGVRFKSAPVEITAGPNQGGLVIYFFDPDGYTLELFQPASNSPG